MRSGGQHTHMKEPVCVQDWPKTLTLFHLYRKALLQSEGYQKSQLARAAIQHSVTQAAEADQAVIEEASTDRTCQ